MANLSDSSANTYREDEDGTRCPGPGCNCPDCVDARHHFHDGPDGHSEDDAMCIYCLKYACRDSSDYCSDACAIDAENDR